MRGETRTQPRKREKASNFNPLPSCEGRQRLAIQSVSKFPFQSTPLMRGETLPLPRQSRARTISIHSPHARGDLDELLAQIAATISIHSPHARGDTIYRFRFLASSYFNPLPSCEGRPCHVSNAITSLCISIHSPHARGDAIWIKVIGCPYPFQSTPLMRGETGMSGRMYAEHGISIHSPHARGDVLCLSPTCPCAYFNPLPSCEGRPAHSSSRSIFFSNFNPLPSCEGRHDTAVYKTRLKKFQSTPLMRGETILWRSDRSCTSHFNPLPSCEGRPRWASSSRFRQAFQSTPLMRGETWCSRGRSMKTSYFNPLPSCEGRQHKPPKILLDSRQFIQQNHHSSFF